MSESLTRRHFLGAAAATTLAVSASRAAEESPLNKIVIGVMGTGGRGSQLSKAFAQLPGVTIGYCCDVDEGRAQNTAKEVEKITEKKPQVVTDFRKILEDKSVNAMIVATCNHWHAPAAILACAHEKHVYVEKPCSHNPAEGELLVQAARKYKRQVQMGNQRRSYDKVQEAIQLVRDGAIGRAYLAQSWYNADRPTIGKGEKIEPPKGLDFDLWQGPAPRKPFVSNYLHYNWHWFWHWGNGELGNNGIHMLDLCRWGLGVDFPIHVSSSGGRYRFQDDQETPDTHMVAFEFADRKMVTWEGLSCVQMPNSQPADVIFYGEQGTLAIRGNGWTIHDRKGKELKKSTAGKTSDTTHYANFLEAIRGNAKLNSEIEEGHRSTLLCHLGNIAHRTGRALKTDSKDGRILSDKDAMAYWAREYEKGWEVKV
jgi:predicted dehydrogenase